MFNKILSRIKNSVRAPFIWISRKYERICRKFFPSATIFLYHQVEDVAPESDTYKLCVSKANFYAHIAYVSKNYRVISLHTLIEEIRTKTLKKNTAVITIDDGYVDNVTNALPILEKYSVPATIFVLAGMIGKSPWWEKNARIMNEDELRSLSKNSLIEIGAHTLNHKHLSRQTNEEQERELSEGKKILEHIIGKPVMSFAYPFGGKNDFNKESVRIARREYLCACANYYGVAKSSTDIFRLPRVNIRDWDIETFKKEI